MQSLLQDLKYAARVLAKSPGFTIVAVVTLALGIGANTAIFSIVNSVLLRPLAYPESHQLLRLYTYSTGQDQDDVTFPAFLDWRARNRSFESLAATWQNDSNLFDHNGPEKIRSAFATTDLFHALGVQPLFGRSFRLQEDRLGYDHVVLLSYGVWQRRFGGDPAILGRSVTVDGSPYSVIGVMPRGFHYPGATDVWMPMGVGEEALIAFHDDRRIRAMETLGRLRAGVSLDRARSDMNAIMAQLAAEHPASDSGWRVRLVPLQEDTVGASRRGLLVLSGAALFVLLVACANLAGLLLASGAGRKREFAIRGALGGSRVRLIRQVLTESILLGIIGGMTGALVALASHAAILALIPHDLPRLDEIHLDSRVFLFAFALSLVTAVAFGLAPALEAARTNLNDRLKSSGRGTKGGPQPRLRMLLIPAEIACAVVLLMGAGLLAKSLLQLLRVQPGYNPQDVITATIGFPDAYSTPKMQANFARQVLAHLESAPGVQDAAATSLAPLVNFKRQIGVVQLEGEPTDPNRGHQSNFTIVTPGFFRTMQIPLIRGRVFNERDDSFSSGAVVISESAARSFWPGQNPIGKHVRFAWTEKQDREVVGVVGDVKQTSLAAGSQPEIYTPFYGTGFSYLTFLVRTAHPSAFSRTLVDAVHKVDSTIAVYDVETLDQFISGSLDPNRFYLKLIGAFGLMALTLAAIGIYGLVSFSVAQRGQEMGIRLALGALPIELQRMILGQGMLLAALGLVAGIIASLAFGRALASFLYGVSASDPATLLLVAAVLAGVAGLACYIPARRATRVDPLIAFRYE